MFTATRSCAPAARRLRDLPDDDLPDPAATVVHDLAAFVLLAALPSEIRRRVDPVAVTIAVPGADWVRPVADALQAARRHAHGPVPRRVRGAPRPTSRRAAF